MIEVSAFRPHKHRFQKESKWYSYKSYRVFYKPMMNQNMDHSSCQWFLYTTARITLRYAHGNLPLHQKTADNHRAFCGLCHSYWIVLNTSEHVIIKLSLELWVVISWKACKDRPFCDLISIVLGHLFLASYVLIFSLIVSTTLSCSLDVAERQHLNSCMYAHD